MTIPQTPSNEASMYDRSVDQRIERLMKAARMMGGRPASWSSPPPHWERRKRWAFALDEAVRKQHKGLLDAATAHFMAAALFGRAALKCGPWRARARMAAMQSAFETGKALACQTLWLAVVAALKARRGENTHGRNVKEAGMWVCCRCDASNEKEHCACGCPDHSMWSLDDWAEEAHDAHRTLRERDKEVSTLASVDTRLTRLIDAHWRAAQALANAGPGEDIARRYGRAKGYVDGLKKARKQIRTEPGPVEWNGIPVEAVASMSPLDGVRFEERFVAEDVHRESERSAAKTIAALNRSLTRTHAAIGLARANMMCRVIDCECAMCRAIDDVGGL